MQSGLGLELRSYLLQLCQTKEISKAAWIQRCLRQLRSRSVNVSFILDGVRTSALACILHVAPCIDGEEV